MKGLYLYKIKINHIIPIITQYILANIMLFYAQNIEGKFFQIKYLKDLKNLFQINKKIIVMLYQILMLAQKQQYGQRLIKLKDIHQIFSEKKFPELKSKLPTLWTHSKFISTVGSVTLETVKKYIEEQKNK